MLNDEQERALVGLVNAQTGVINTQERMIARCNKQIELHRTLLNDLAREVVFNGALARIVLDGLEERDQHMKRLKEDAERKKTRRLMRPKLRLEILKRDKFRCVLCGRGTTQGVAIEVDHIKPVCDGGTNDPANLQVLCAECNAGKGGGGESNVL